MAEIAGGQMQANARASAMAQATIAQRCEGLRAGMQTPHAGEEHTRADPLDTAPASSSNEVKSVPKELSRELSKIKAELTTKVEMLWRVRSRLSRAKEGAAALETKCPAGVKAHTQPNFHLEFNLDWHLCDHSDKLVALAFPQKNMRRQTMPILHRSYLRWHKLTDIKSQEEHIENLLKAIAKDSFLQACQEANAQYAEKMREANAGLNIAGSETPCDTHFFNEVTTKAYNTLVERLRLKAKREANDK
eukprot:NODE_9983_length_1385_cov_4.428458.p1 GENE.NODE_9983_length_1385_cov_4.428458~~NODE_9983_length_1385_cov_4.428458.p1  ORF type:complete len:248 (-),score=41.81 NODE_9983_length_1385_cov_4.428458:120-863(-)